MNCAKHGFEMVSKSIDAGIVVWHCPWGCKRTVVTDRPSASRPARSHQEFVDSLESK